MLFTGIISETSNGTAGEDYKLTEQEEMFEPEDVATYTLDALWNCIPPAFAGIVFLSGGQEPGKAIDNLNQINQQMMSAPWCLSYSFGRALQSSVLAVWAGD